MDYTSIAAHLDFCFFLCFLFVLGLPLGEPDVYYYYIVIIIIIAGLRSQVDRRVDSESIRFLTALVRASLGSCGKAKFCLQMVRLFFPGFSSFRPPSMNDRLVKYIWKGRKTQIKKKKKKKKKSIIIITIWT